MKDETALEARERLLGFLETALPPAARAADIMISRLVVVPAGATVAAAKSLLLERRVNAAPVVAADGRAIGAVTRQILDAALQHELGDRPVERVMERELEWIDPTAPADEVGRRMLSRHPRFVLVGDPASGQPLGIVTRMQVLRHLHGRLSEFEERVDRRAESERLRREGASALLERRLDPALGPVLDTVAAISRREEVPIYLVGGLVRDLLLERENRDLDLVVEGDGPHVARLLATALGGTVKVHQAFLTAVVTDPSGLEIDVATARSEFYRAPAALPEVQMSLLRQDLYRRDFTINTLAIRLGPGPHPELIDYFGGRRDLKERTLRVLHSLSFLDDPTRVLRAVRLELRLGFHMAPETLRLVEVAVAEGAFDRLSGSRLRDELTLLLDDPAIATRGLERLAELGLLPVLHPHLELEETVRERLRQALAAWDWYRLEALEDPPVRLWRLLLMALAGELGDLDGAELERLADRLYLAGAEQRRLVGFPGRVAAARAAMRASDRTDGMDGHDEDDEGPAPHRVSEALAELSGEELLLVMAYEGERGRAWVRRELTELRHLSLTIRGADLVAAGVPPGPRIGEALQATRRARLDGRIGPQEEMTYALAAAGEEGG